MTQIVELLDKGFKIAMNNMLKNQIEKINNMFEKMENFRNGMKIISVKWKC